MLLHGAGHADIRDIVKGRAFAAHHEAGADEAVLAIGDAMKALGLDADPRFLHVGVNDRRLGPQKPGKHEQEAKSQRTDQPVFPPHGESPLLVTHRFNLSPLIRCTTSKIGLTLAN
jgi:hypothetical protein